MTRWRVVSRFACTCCCLFVATAVLLAILFAPISLAQAVPPPQHWEVFLRRGETAESFALSFINLLDGEMTSVQVSGDNFSLTQEGVIFLDSEGGAVMLASSDGSVRQHPFITLAADAARIDWVVSADGRRIAWTIARQLDDGALATTTWLADSDGANLRELLADRPRAGIRLLPVAFRNGRDQLIMEARADEDPTASPYIQRAGLFALDFSGGDLESRSLPGDQTCYCAYTFGADVMLRLRPALDGGFAAEVFALDSGETRVIPPPPPDGNYPYAGNLLLSDDQSLAIYALSRIDEDSGAVRSLLARIDLQAAQQEIVSRPIPALARPIAFSEAKSALLFTIAGESGAWKLRLADGHIVKVADAAYLGRMTG